MVTPELIQFVKSELAKGASKEAIIISLKANGWTSVDIDETFQAINPVNIPTNTVVNPIITSNIQNKQKPKFLKLGLVIVLPIILVLGGALVYASGYIIPLENEFSKSVQASRDSKGSTFKFHTVVDASGLKSSNELIPGMSNISTFDMNGSYDITDPKFIKSSVDFSFNSGTFELDLTTKTTEGSLYLNLTKAPNLGFFSLTPFENKWIVFPYESKSGVSPTDPLFAQIGIDDNTLSGVTEEHKQQIYNMTKEASFIKITKKHLPGNINGSPSFHFDFELDREGILTYLKNITAYISTINPDSVGQLPPLDIEEYNKAFDSVKNFHGEAWIGIFDHLPHKVTVDFDFEDPTNTEDGVVKFSITSESTDWNKELEVEIPKETTTIEKLISSVFGGSMNVGEAEQEADNIPDISGNSMISAREKGIEASIKSTLSNMRAQAEIYFDGNKNYKGFCRSKGSSGAYNLAITLPENTVYKCNDTSNSWAAWAKLPTNKYWCVDSTGSSSEIADGGVPSGTSCSQITF
jgi:hypothetical protein